MTKDQELRARAYQLALEWAEVAIETRADVIMFEAERIYGWLCNVKVEEKAE